MKFKSNAKYNEEPKTGSVFTLKYNSLGIVIHKYVGCGDALFLNCSALDIFNCNLGTEDLTKLSAKRKKLSCVKLRKSEKMLTDSIQIVTLNLIDIRRTQNVNQKSG